MRAVILDQGQEAVQAGGGGAGGRVAVYFVHNSSSLPEKTTVSGGTGRNDGEPGTVAWSPIGGYTEKNVIPSSQCVQGAGGNVTISFKAKDYGDWINGFYTGEFILDDSDPGASFVGDWVYLAATGSNYGDSYYYNDTLGDGDTFIWTPDLPAAGNYRVYAWWTEDVDRATDAPYTINYNGGSGSETVDMNQQANGGRWNLLGTYYFEADGSETVVLTDDADGKVIADAVKFSPSSDTGQTVTFKNGDKGWGSLKDGSSSHYGTDRHFVIGDGGSTNLAICTWVPEIPMAGDYEVYAWWHAHSNRATDAPYTINYNGGSDTVDVNQEINGSQWNLLGTYEQCRAWRICDSRCH
jgi:hypothetical protein